MLLDIVPFNDNLTLKVSGIILIFSIVGGIFWFYNFTIKTNQPKFPGIPEIKGNSIIYGILKNLKDDHPTNLQKLALKNNTPVFQCLMGTQRIIFINSYSQANEWFIKNQTALIDRPLFYTFHKLVSTSQGLTIGTSPWDETCKKRRLNVQRYMTTPAIKERAGLIDTEGYSLLKDLYRDSKNEFIYPYKYTQRLALNFTTMLSYATRFDKIDTPLLGEILDLVKIISSFRSTNKNLQDFVPFVRLLPENERKREAINASKTREIWLSKLTQEAINHKDTRKSIVGDFANSDGLGRLNIDDIKSICVGLVSGGFETIGSTASLIYLQLLNKDGNIWQERIYNELIEIYGNVETAYENVLFEEKCEFGVSFIRELLRMYAVIPLIPARKTMKQFEWQGTIVPEGATVILNAQAANHDRQHFGSTVDDFIPDRFMKDESINIPPYHFTFGAGSRACTAINLSNRILYAILTRTCLLFKVHSNPSLKPTFDYINFAEDRTAQTYWPKNFQIKLEARDESMVTKCLEISHTNCKEELSYSMEYAV
ncbi:hypothetical protein C6P40_001454 [Pichia californica]|uniref:Cytochrome P450 n=1 Tax=Pichia californica TaxID=460514 RepID=A0A9P6WJ24_9ASCO|nr:hypothetical protein C6P42_000298 [[Candida] californica]KAG0688056.1 hypothetical protein C6P40_001454 [[Candida] californica]